MASANHQNRLAGSEMPTKRLAYASKTHHATRTVVVQNAVPEKPPRYLLNSNPKLHSPYDL